MQSETAKKLHRHSNTRSERSHEAPPWELILSLIAPLLDSKTLALSSTVCHSWSISLSSDHLWHPLCSAHFPFLSNLGHADPYHRLYGLDHTATKRRHQTPSKPKLSLSDLVFTIIISTTRNNIRVVCVAKPGRELCVDPNGLFTFDIIIDDDDDDDNGCSFDVGMDQEVIRISWNVFLEGWGGFFTMMDCEGKLSFAQGAKGWFSKALPSPGCCSTAVATSGIVADLNIGICSRKENDGNMIMRVDKVCVGVLSVVNWRYVSVDDGLRYLQHFLLPS